MPATEPVTTPFAATPAGHDGGTPGSTIDLSGRPAPRLGGLNPQVIGIELRRVARNRRTIIFTLFFPVLMLLMVANSIPERHQPLGPGVLADVGAYVMVSMALYGASLAATSGGAAVSIERASGWSRQLRLTPLNPVVYIMIKVFTAFLLGAVALTTTFVVGLASDVARMDGRSIVECAVIVLVGSLVFAAFGLFMGYLLPSDNVMQFLGPGLAVLGFLGGLFQGPVDTGTVLGRIQSFTPIYGLSQVAHWPLTLTNSGGYDRFDGWWLVNLLGWGAFFVAGAVWRFRKDTARV